MIRIEFAQLAQKVLIEKNSNGLSLINIIDTLQTKTFPFVVPEMALAVRTSREVSDPKKVELEIIFKQGKDIFLSHTKKIEFQDKYLNNLNLGIYGMGIRTPLPLEIIIKHDGKKRAGLKLPIIHIGAKIK